jgi:5,10-methylenetetrahydromethanopterin reductase
MVEFWRAGGHNTTIESVVAAEAEGWDGQMFMDSQSLSPDPYVLMGACAMRTERIRLSPGVTNPFTRHLAVTAASVATLQWISGGRAVLGIGRGDSALAYLGHGPVRLPAFERAMKDLQTLLSGGKLAFGAPEAEAASLDSLSLADRPTDFGLRWLPDGLPKPPLDVAATGPRVIEMAAALAEQVTFSVGAVPDRIRWAVELAQAARARRGLPATGGSYGAQIIVVCHRERQAALDMAGAAVASLGRFQVIQGAPAGPLGPGDAENFAAIRSGYNMNEHAKTEASKLIGASLSPDFVGRFAIAGPPDHCVERLLELIRCGLERLVVVGPGFYPDGTAGPRSLFTAEVVPAVRAELGAASTVEGAPAG